MMLRRQFELPEEDRIFLDRYGCQWETVIDGSSWLFLHEFPTLCSGYNQKVVTAAIRIEPSYPKSALDMVYFYPTITRKDGQPINATESVQTIDDKLFQRWSRHYSMADPYEIGASRLEIHIYAIENWLKHEFQERA